MKSSKYIFILPYDKDRTIVFNGFTKHFMLLKKEVLDSVIIILQSPDEYKDSHPIIIDLLKSKEFIIDDDFDELAQLQAERSIFVNSKEYKTTILSTFNCNYNCWYCVQKHVKKDVNTEQMDLIVKHVKTYLTENNIESYVLSWFGGEPLMEPNFINYVSDTLYNFCINNNVEFSGAITTNGALMNEKTIKLLLNNHIDYYHITIDGDKQTHDKIKHQEGEDSSFVTILQNIVKLLELNERANVTLRLNYTIKTIKSNNLISDINSIIPAKLRHRISVDMHKVWQINECSIPIKDLGLLVKKFYDSGYNINTDHIFSICYVDKVHHNTIYYNGGVDKCDNHEVDRLRGYIDSTGHIIWHKEPIIDKVNPLDNENCCHQCKYYPLCYACCPVDREERIKKNGKLTCKYEGQFDIFEHRILEFCVRQMVKNNIQL